MNLNRVGAWLGASFLSSPQRVRSSNQNCDTNIPDASTTLPIPMAPINPNKSSTDPSTHNSKKKRQREDDTHKTSKNEPMASKKKKSENVQSSFEEKLAINTPKIEDDTTIKTKKKKKKRTHESLGREENNAAPPPKPQSNKAVEGRPTEGDHSVSMKPSKRASGKENNPLGLNKTLESVNPQPSLERGSAKELHNLKANPPTTNKRSSGEARLSIEPHEASEVTKKRKVSDKNNASPDDCPPSPFLSAETYSRAREPSTAASLDSSHHDDRSNTGSFSSQELDRLNIAVEYFRQVHGLTQHQMNEMIQLRGFKSTIASQRKPVAAMWAAIIEALPNRPRKSIMKACRRRFHNLESSGTKWTSEDDDRLTELYQQHGNKWEEIASGMDRKADDCRDRWRNYVQHREKLQTGPWTLDEEEALMRAVQTCAQKLLDNWMEKNHTEQTRNINEFESLVSFTAVAAEMGGRRNRLQCRKKWEKLEKKRVAPI